MTPSPVQFQSFFPPGGTNLLSLPGWNLENNGLECLECSVFWDNGCHHPLSIEPYLQHGVIMYSSKFQLVVGGHFDYHFQGPVVLKSMGKTGSFTLQTTIFLSFYC